MRSLLAALFLALLVSAHGRNIVDANSQQPLFDRTCALSLLIDDQGQVTAVFNRLHLKGHITGRTPTPDGYTCRMILRSRDRKQAVRGHYTLSRVDHPYPSPPGSPDFTYSELLRSFRGKCSDARMLKPHRRQFFFHGREVYYPELS